MADPPARELTPAEIKAKIAMQEAAAAKLTAEAEQARAGARYSLAEALREECKLAVEQITRLREEEKRERELAEDHYAHLYIFNDSVSSSSVAKCEKELTYWSRSNPKCEMTILFNSPGGEVVSGMDLFGFICELRRKGHLITTATRGYAASMAGILLQAGDKRIMGKEAYLLIHEVSFSAAGSMGDVEDTVEWVKKVQNRVLDIFADRSKMKRDDIETHWKRKDWWLSSVESLEAGFVDEVR